MTDRFDGPHPGALTYTDRHGNTAGVSVFYGRVGITFPDGQADVVSFAPDALRFLADLTTGTDAQGHPRAHLMMDCYWAQCPAHTCPYTHSHTRGLCGRPTCREN